MKTRIKTMQRTARRVAIALVLCTGAACAQTPPPAGGDGTALSAEQAAFADELARRTFDYFWETTDPDDCLAPDRWPSAPFSSIAATGFALTAYGIGAERGFVTRAAAADRTLRCLEVYRDLPQGPQAEGVAGHKGFFYHFLDMEDGTRHRTTELSSVDTSLLFAGVLFAQSYFDRDDPVEQAIRETADALYRRADWTFFLRGADDAPAANLPESKGLAMGWKPEIGFESHDWVGYNEGMLIYVLALGSPTHPVTREAWDEGWAARLDEEWKTYYGYEHLNFEP
ncbi:MAG TPA: glucoamylase family protein, partial [Woeseiaceae bacterium]|nr:glucoamylase family protein [Woeseiaceae bacterium]